MSNILTVEFFIGELNIPNITGSLAPATANANNLKWFIAKYEPKFLEALLGESLCAAFLDGITVTAPAVPSAKWTALKDKIFTFDSQGYNNFSPAASYVYYFVMRDKITVTTSSGEMKQENKAATTTRSNNVMKMVQAWNQMSQDAEKIWAWLEANIDTYPEFDPTQENPFEHINMFNI